MLKEEIYSSRLVKFEVAMLNPLEQQDGGLPNDGDHIDP